jgi:hypothetical protein
VRRRLAAGERVAVILLDALGLKQLMRHRDHPLVQRLTLAPLRSQFPSTTTAHVTTMHFGLPVEEHGLYEWRVFEPALNAIICPLRFGLAGVSTEAGSLIGRLDPAVLAPGPTFYASLQSPSVVLQPAAIAGSVYSRLACTGAAIDGFATLEAGLARLGETLGRGAAEYGFLYWDEIDRLGHIYGPDSPQFAAAARHALDAVWAARDGLAGVTVLLTADHGQIEVRPDRVDYLDELWPALSDLLVHARPAGSSRDVFLHVRPGAAATAIAELSARLDGRAEVCLAEELFPRIGPRLRARLGDVAVLPAPGRQAGLRSATGNEQWFRGHHGGRQDAEMSTYLAELL